MLCFLVIGYSCATLSTDIMPCIRRHRQILLLLGLLCLISSESMNAQWAKLNQYNGTFYNEVFFYDQNLGFITSHNGSVLRTTNGGTSWSTVTLPSASSSANRDISFVSTTTGFISGEDGIWKSTNGGATWTNVTPSGATGTGSSSCWFRNASVGVWGYGGGCFDSVVTFWRTTDGGSSWNSSTYTSGIDATVGGMAYANNTFYASGGSGKFWKSTDDGVTWALSNTNSAGWQEDLISSPAGLFIASSDGTTCGSNGGGKLLRSTDGGSNWTTTSFTNTVMWGVSMYSSLNGWAVGDYAKAYKTTDGGATWVESSCGLKAGDRLDDVYMIDATHGFAVGDGIYRFAANEFVSAPDTIDFGDVIIGTSRGDSLAVITAIGNAGSITSRAILGANVGDFSSPDALTVQQPVPGCGSSATRVRFSPLTLGVKTARLEFTLQGLNNPLVVYLKGRGVRPRIVGDRLNRFDTLTCDNEAFDTITIANNGDAPIQIDSVAIANFLGFFSVVDPQLPLTIAPFGFHKFILRGRVVSYGDMGARLYFYTNDPDFQDSAWTLDVRMYKHNLEYQPTQDTTIVIPSAAPGQTSRKSLVIVNRGTVGQKIEEVTGEGAAPNIKANVAPPVVVRAGDSTTIEFSGTANDTIARCRRFRVFSQPCDRERFITVCYQAVEGDLVLPSTLTYSVTCGELFADNLSLENSGNANLQIDSIRLEGSGRDRFSYTTTSPLPLTIPPSGKEGLTITFQGGSSRGSSSALLLLFRKDNTIDTVQLEGNVVGSELLSSPSQVDLGSLCPDELTTSGLSLENVGEAEAQIGAITFETTSGTFTLIQSPSTIAAGASDSLRFSFMGENPGSFKGILLIAYEPCGRVDTISIIGEIYAPALEIDPLEIDLGQVPLGRTRAGQVDLWNRSSEDVNITLSRIGHPDLTITNPGSSALLLLGSDSLQLSVSVSPTSVGIGRDTIEVSGVGHCNELLRIPVRWNGVAGGPYVAGDVDFGDLFCDVVEVRKLYLYNGSDEDIRVDSLISSDIATLRTETAQTLPTSILSQDSLEVTLYLEDSDPGEFNEYIAFYVQSTSGKFDTVNVQVFGRRYRSNSTFTDVVTEGEITNLDLPPLYSCRSAIDTQIVIYNSGNLADTLDLLSLDPTSLTIRSPLPVIVEPRSSAVLDIHIERSTAGSAELLLEMESRVCPSKKSLSINVDYFEGEVAFPEKIDFELICVADTVSMTVMLENLLPEAVSIESITLTGDSQFSFSRSVPTLLRPNEIDSILLEVKPESESFYNGELVLQLSSPCRREIRIPVSAAAVDCPKPDIRLRGSNVIGRWGETVRLPVMIEATRLEGIDKFSFNLRAAKNLLDLREIRISPKAQEWFKLTESAYDADSGKLTLTITRTEKVILPGEINQFVDTLLTVDALVLRGDEISTPLDIEPIVLSPEGTILATDGEFLLEDYCDAHGRLLHITGELSLKPVSPNPVSDRAVIEYELPFSDRARLCLFDARGVLVRTLLDEVLPSGRRQTELEVMELPSGQYTISLEIGLQRIVEQFIVRK